MLERLPLERISLKLAALLLLALTLLVMTVLIPALEFDVPDVDPDGTDTRTATITRVLEDSMQSGPRGPERYQRLEVEFDSQTRVVEHVTGEQDPRQFDLAAGDEVLVSTTEGTNGEVTFIVDYARDSQLWLLSIAFAALVLIVGRWQGLASLVGMLASLLIILRFIIPGIVSGHDPVTISVLGAIAIMLFSLFFSHGLNRKTATAVAGTTLALAITAILASVAVDFARLSGLDDEQAATLNIVTNGGINAQGLLLAGIIIGALGVLDDVTVAQASSVFELKAANPALQARELFMRAMNIGRDHIASTVNTLFLAYAGASLPLLILLSLQTEPTSVLVNREFLATEIVRTLVGSIGIVASVPLTTVIAAFATRVDLPLRRALP